MNETKLKILGVAFILFLQKNFKEVTMEEIVQKSGFSKGAFYHYFKSKEQLFAEVIDMFFVKIPTTTKRPFDESSLYVFYHEYLAHASQAFAILGKSMKEASVDLYNYFSLTLDAMKRLPDFREKSKIISAEVIKIWIRVIKSAREKGEISTGMTDQQIAYFFKFTIEGMGMKSKLEDRSSEDNDKELIELWDSFYNQIKTKK
jgi:TetR/AcrR family transcriptional regulator, transcriptional repressor for nem operon